MNNTKSIALALFTATLLAYVGEWWGFGAMICVALIQTYREHRFRKWHFAAWELEQQEIERKSNNDET